MNDVAIYTVRPGGTSLWMPSILATSLGIRWGDHLTNEQYESEDIQGLIRRRIVAEKSRKKVSK